MHHQKLGSLRLSAFVSPEAPFAAFLTAVVVFVPPFYAGSVGLGLSTVGLIFALTKLWDVVTDPAFGILSDKWQTRFGKRRPWLVLSVPALGLCTYMVFVPGDVASANYFAVWMVLLYVGWTIGSISHMSWAAELSSEYHERSRISAFKQAAALVGTIGLIAVAAASDVIFDGDPSKRMLLIFWFIAITLPAAVCATLWSAGEPKPHPNARIPDVGAFRVLLRSAPLRRLLAANVMIGIGTGATGGMLLFYVEAALGLGKWASFTLIPFLISGLLWLPIFVRMSKRIGKHRTLCYALIYQIFAGLLYLVVPTGEVFVATLAFLLLGANQAVGTYIPRAIMADVSDHGTLETGVQKTGLYMALLQSSSKIAAALAVGLSYPILQLGGFDPNPDVVNSAAAIDGLRMMMVAFPGFMFALTVLVMWNYPISEERQIAIRRELEGSAGGAAS